MTSLKLEERKNTTEAGLTALEDLVCSFKFDSDIVTVQSDGGFYCVADVGGATNYVWSDKALWQIKDSELSLRAYCEQYGQDSHKEVNIADCKKINFQTALKGLESVITRYNKAIIEKDTQIEAFLKFCSEFKNI